MWYPEVCCKNYLHYDFPHVCIYHNTHQMNILIMPITRNLRAQTVIAIKAPVPDGTSRPLIIIFSYSPRQTKHVCGVYTPMKALSASPLSTWAIFSVDSPTNWHRPNMSSDIVIQNFFVNHSIFILHSTSQAPTLNTDCILAVLQSL